MLRLPLMWIEGFLRLGDHRGTIQGEDLSAESWKTKPSRQLGERALQGIGQGCCNQLEAASRGRSPRDMVEPSG